jgi:hypothetical protein
VLKESAVILKLATRLIFPKKVVTFKQGKALGEKFLVKAKPKGKIKKAK